MEIPEQLDFFLQNSPPWPHPRNREKSLKNYSSQTWLFQTWWLAIFMRSRPFALLCALLCTCVYALLRSFACFCCRPYLAISENIPKMRFCVVFQYFVLIFGGGQARELCKFSLFLRTFHVGGPSVKAITGFRLWNRSEKSQIASGFPSHPWATMCECSPCAPAEARRWFFWVGGGKFCGKFYGKFWGILLDPQNKAQIYRGIFRSIFREKIRASKTIFRANFILQTCLPKGMRCLPSIVAHCFFMRGRGSFWAELFLKTCAPFSSSVTSFSSFSLSLSLIHNQAVLRGFLLQGVASLRLTWGSPQAAGSQSHFKPVSRIFHIFCIFLSLRSCRSSSVIFFDFWEGSLQEIWREFCGIFWTHRRKAQKLGEKFRSIFREKIRASKTKIFRANFVLQTCHPNIFVSACSAFSAFLLCSSDTCFFWSNTSKCHFQSLLLGHAILGYEKSAQSFLA